MLTPADHHRDAIELRAEAFLSRFPVSPRGFALLRLVCREEGIELLEADLCDIDGVLRREGDRWSVYLNRQDARNRSRVTLARLLGHYFLHAGDNDAFVVGGFCTGCTGPTGAEDREARAFAAALLIPNTAVTYQFPHSRPTAPQVRALARRCGVSPLAMALRLRGLGYAVPSPE